MDRTFAAQFTCAVYATGFAFAGLVSYIRGYEPIKTPIIMSASPGNVTSTNGTEPIFDNLRGSLPMGGESPALAFADLVLFLLWFTAQNVLPGLPGAINNAQMEFNEAMNAVFGLFFALPDANLPALHYIEDANLPAPDPTLAENVWLIERVVRLEIAAEELEKTGRAVARATEEAIRERDGARNEAAKGHEDYQELENELQDAEIAKQKLQQDLAKLQDSSKETINLLNGKLKELEKEKAELEEAEAAAEKDSENAIDPFSILAKDYERMSNSKQRVERAEAAAKRDLRDANKRIGELEDEATKAIEDVNDRIAKLEANATKAAQDATDCIAKLEAEATKAVQDKAKETEDMKATHEAEATKAAQDKAKEIEDLKAAHELRKKMALSKLEEDLTEMTGKYEKAQADYKKADDDLYNTGEDLRDLQTSKDDLDDDYYDLEERCKTAERNLAIAKGELAGETTRADVNQANYYDMIKTHEDLSTQYGDLETELQELQAEHQELDTGHDALKEKHQELKAEHEELFAELAEAVMESNADEVEREGQTRKLTSDLKVRNGMLAAVRKAVKAGELDQDGLLRLLTEPNSKDDEGDGDQKEGNKPKDTPPSAPEAPKSVPTGAASPPNAPKGDGKELAPLPKEVPKHVGDGFREWQDDMMERFYEEES